MKRRQFLGITAGTVAGSALVGSGAFNVGRVDRGLDVEVVKDQKAYLSLSETPDDQGRSYEVGGQVYISIPGIHEETDAEGVGMDSEYWFDDIIQITNQGTETIDVETKIEMDDGIDVTLYDSDDAERTLFTDEPLTLSVGESIIAGLYINTFGVSTGDYSGILTIVGNSIED